MKRFQEPVDEPAISDAEIRRQLDRILSFPELQASKRRREMLKFIVEEVLAGRAAGLKGTTVAMAVFDRGADFDQQADPVVRLEARKLRRDLDNYYAGAGRYDLVRIEIPKGRYVAVFNYQRDPTNTQRDQTVDAPAKAAIATGIVATEPLGRRRVPWLFAFIGTTAVVLVLVVVLASFILRDGGYHADGGLRPASEASLRIEGFRPLEESKNTALIAEGVTHKIVSDLLRFSDLRIHFVPAAIGSDNSAQADLPTTQFTMSGTVYSDGESIVVSARLLRTDDGRLLWSDSFTEALNAKSLIQIEAEVATQIATVVGQQYGVIQNTIHEDILAIKADPAMDSYICVARALVYRRTIEKEDYETTRRCLEAAVKRDADYADAWAMLGHLRFDAARFGYDPEFSGEEGFYSAREAASRALVIDPKNIEAYKVLSFVEEYLGNFDAAISMAERAVALNPNAPDALANLGNRLCARGRFKEGVPLLKRALERSVRPVPFYYQMIAVDHMMRSEWDDMLEAASRAVADNSGPSYALLAIAEGGLGNSRLARKHLATMAERSPLLANDPRAAFKRYRLDPALEDALVDALAMARAMASAEK